MKTKILIPVIILVALAAWPSCAGATMSLMDGKLSADSAASLGYEYTHVDGDRPAHFQAYRDVSKGFLFEGFHLYTEWNDPAKPYYLRLDGIDLNQDDKNLCAEVGLYGTFRLKFNYKETPRLFSTGNKFLETYQGNGRYALADSTQLALQDFAPAPAAFAVNQEFRDFLGNLVDTAPTVDLGFLRETSRLDGVLNVAPGLKLRLNYMHENKDGSKVSSSGVYQRGTVLPNIERFRVVVFEMPERIDWDSDIMNAGVELVRDTWHASFNYTFQNFTNNIDALRWDNPFKAEPDAVTGGSAALRGIVNSHGLQVLPPDSYSHTGTVTGGLDLPFWMTRLTGTVSVGGTWQNDDFFPASANTAMIDTATGNNANLVSDLPKRSLDGLVMTVLQNYVFTMRPVEPLSVTGKYRYYYYDNKTDKIQFDGYAGLADSQWEDIAVKSRTPGYRRQNADLEFDYDISKMFQARAGYGYERFNRQERNVEATNEHKVGAGVTVKPAKWAKLLLDYQWASRRGISYTPTATTIPAINIEDPTARMWDQSNRTRHKADTRMTVSPMANLDFCTNGSFVYDSYDTHRLGLRSSWGVVAGADITYSPFEFMTLAANYSFENFRHRINQGSKTSFAAGTTTNDENFSDSNLFDTRLVDRTHNFGVSANGRIIPEKLEFVTSYNYSRGIGKVNTWNPNQRTPSTTPTSIDSSLALPFDTNKCVTQEVRAELIYHFMKHFALNVRYLYENFNIDDYAWKNLGNQVGTINSPGTATVGIDTTRVLLLNNQYSDHEAHVGVVMLSYNF